MGDNPSVTHGSERIDSEPIGRRGTVRFPLWLVALVWLCGPGLVAQNGPAALNGPVFVDRAVDWGLEFSHFNGMSGEFYFPEMTGQGGALVDYDNDGDLDVYLVQGGMLGPGKTLADALSPPPPGTPLGDRLFRNDLAAGSAGTLTPRFVDVTGSSGIDALGYGMGVASGDIDNDGWVDLYVTNYGANQLWRNRGDGTFEESARERGVEDDAWSTSAAFFDYDADGWLDLYVVNYVEFDLGRNPACFATSTRRDYCGPSAFPPQADRLFRNRGDGTFEDVTRRELRGYRQGPGLGVSTGDFNGDGRLDLYVANDGSENQLWIARERGGFDDEALFSGAAVNRDGKPEASMGVAVGDFDRDGDEDLFLTHLMGETNTLYVNDGSAVFEDRTLAVGLSAPSLRYTSFGTGWLDYDNDGWSDLVILNGAVKILESQAAAGERFPLRQPNQLFRNDRGRFVDRTAQAGEPLAASEVSRGAAFGDIDNDGDVDALLFNNNGPARLLVNQVGAAAGWLGVGVRPGPARPGLGRTALGSKISVATRAGSRTGRFRTDGSYCSANDPRVVAGLGAEASSDRLRVEWLDGGITDWRSPPAKRYVELYAEAGRP